MRLTTVILIASLMQVSAAGHAQKISLSRSGAALEDVIKELRKQSGYDFIITDNLLNKSRAVSINIKKMDFVQTLEQIFKDQPLSYIIENHTVIVKSREKSFLENLVEKIQEFDARGKVLSKEGLPLVGATVKVKGKSLNTNTNTEGNFVLRNAGNRDILIISYIGYATKEVPARESMGEIILELSDSKLDEIQIIAYGTTTRRLNTGSVGSVQAETIEKQPVGNVLNALTARVPGLDITQQSGIPGSGVTVRVRGTNSLTATANEPLYLIDGVPFFGNSTNTVPNNFRQQPGGGASPFNSLNPGDIESIEVLKDADATAIYGSRGANGVILITTKKGKAGASKIDANFSSGFGQVARMMDVLNRRDYLDMRYEALRNDGATIATASFAPDLTVWDTTRTTNWQEELIGNTAQYTNAQLGFSGGDLNTSYSLSGNYWKETTVFPGDFADVKGSSRFSLNHTSVDQRWKAQLTGTYLKENNNLSFNDLSSTAITLPPLGMDFYLPDGKLNWVPNVANPFASLNMGFDAKTTNLNANSIISYQLANGLEVKAQLGYSNLRYATLYTVPETSQNPAGFTGPANRYAEYGDQTTETWNIEPQLTYSVNLLGQPLNILVGTTFQKTRQQGALDYGTGYVDDALLENKGSAAAVTSRTAYSDYKYNSVFARINYNVKAKYILNLTGRRDGSSRFGPENKFGNFGAVGAAWIFTEEKGLKKKFSFLSFGKLRASYGVAGSDAIANYGYLSLYNNVSSAYPYPGQNGVGLQPASLANTDFQWESTRKADVALEFGFLKDRILFNTNYYQNRSSNQLVGYPISQVSGFATVPLNLPAVIQNTGWEMELNTINISKPDFSWTTGFNITLPSNKLIEYPELASSSNANTYVVGEPLTIVKVVPTLGIDPANGVMRYQNRIGETVNNIALLSVLDRTIAINTGKQLYGGFSNAFTYKNFELDVFFQFSKANGLIWNASGTYVPGYYGNIPQFVYDRRWKGPDDTEATMNKLTQSATSPAYLARPRSTDEEAYGNIFFARLKNVALSYQFNQPWVSKAKIQNLRIYAQAQNLATFTDYLGMDPENQSASIAPLAVMTFGLQVTF